MLGIRLTNPQITGSKYLLDVEFKSDTPTQLYNANVRLWFDLRDFTKALRIKGLATGYGTNLPTQTTGATPVISLPRTLFNWFNFSSDACYANGDIQLGSPSTAPVLGNSWTKLFQVELTLQSGHSQCPPVVIDLERNPENGGFLPNSDGFKLVVINDNVTKVVLGQATHLNWENTSDKVPFGHSVGCI